MLGRVFDPRIFEQPRMVELVEYVKHLGWLDLFEKQVPSVFEKGVREFIYTIKFTKDGLSLFVLE